ncbi:histidine--tRNA ligase [Daejeonella sp. H1SJ63]|uniref:histidine--tRNA ligase n=1 Tax=Daejeonella sp. H1SJ63 TaxID=3034145 RepID=UPI0023ED1AB8|nr:histidine--tRNA ligase [Daejeonella sp. H1SJ63]
MAIIKPSIPKGTRDFSASEMVKRNHIFNTISSVFKKFGYQEIQTPTMENLTTLTGKYGDEGDKLIFKVLNSGDFLSNIPEEKLTGRNSQQLISDICEKALRYDLTVPFARYVVMHRNEISFPFKRFQIQPVWRADRPQKGRYREFYQCDADVVGSESLINEAEFVLIYHEALSKLGLKDFTIKINNRKILSGIAEIIGKPELIIDMTVAIDKLDKIGFEGVTKELIERGFTDADIETLKPIIALKGSNEEKLNSLRSVLAVSETGLKGISEIETIFSYLARLSILNTQYSILNVELDITLARGLNYYTGAIFEVKTNEVAMGSIGGGGRYDDLTGMFGLSNLTGVGISFGADRIYDVLEELNLFPESATESTKVLISNFDAEAEKYALPVLQQIRNAGISAEIYPSSAKLKKQMAYADDKSIPYVILIGSDEMESGLLTLKNMKNGEQQKVSVEEIIALLGG